MSKIEKHQPSGELSPAVQGEQPNAIVYQKSELIKLYVGSFKKFGNSQKNYRTYALQYIDYLLEQALTISEASFDNFIAHRGASASYVSYLRKFLKYCKAQNISLVRPDSPKIAPAANELILAFIANNHWINDRSKNTYINGLNQYFGFLGDNNWQMIDARNVAAFRDYLKDNKELSAFTINNYLSAIKELVKFCLKNYQMADGQVKALNEVKEVKTLKTNTKKYYKNALPPDVLKRLIAGEDTRWAAYWGIMGYCGLRVKELQALKWADVDFDLDTLKVLGKGQNTKEEVKLFSKAKALLKGFLGEVKETVQGSLPKNFEICPYSYPTLYNHFKASLKAIGVDETKYSLHSLRHTCGQQMLESGNPLEFVQRQLRHASADTTAVYVNKKLDEMFLKNVQE
ncbi:site-specific integrase [uncultured Microscilla sp.]|uniref:tyrosine-type recombinase/integrase n=1 Tax=uncultured Microscilla sp. TaxID=432653 RepID=UPI00262F936B|nr:site-specific integrase [uncultured Microscilla sp.]